MEKHLWKCITPPGLHRLGKHEQQENSISSPENESSLSTENTEGLLFVS